MLTESRVYRCHCKMHVSTSSFIQCKRSLASPWWQLWALTVAAESLLPKAEQHALTHAAVGWLVKMLHRPYVLPILFRHLLGIRENNSSWSDLLVKSRQFNKERKDCIKCFFFSPSAPAEQVKVHCSCLPSATPPEWRCHYHPHQSLSSCLWAPVPSQNTSYL